MELTILPQQKSDAMKRIIAACNGEWQTLAEIVKASGVRQSTAHAVLNKHLHAHKVAIVEKRREGRTHLYRVTNTPHLVDFDELDSELRPLLEAIRDESKKHMAAISPSTIGRLVIRAIHALDARQSGKPVRLRSANGKAKPPEAPNGERACSN